MKNIKDYLHLYLGCEYRYFMNGVTKTGSRKNKGVITYAALSHIMARIEQEYNIKPILRPLSDMTEEERKKCERKVFNGDARFFYTTEAFLFLLSKHFDLFGLIDAGLAIDKTKLKL